LGSCGLTEVTSKRSTGDCAVDSILPRITATAVTNAPLMSFYSQGRYAALGDNTPAPLDSTSGRRG
jgi:hypothetical protein